MQLRGLRRWRPLNSRSGLCVWLFSCEASPCMRAQPTVYRLHVRPSAQAGDVQRYCSCSCRMWRYISVMPLPITFNASQSKCMYIPPYKCKAFRLNQRPVFYIADHPLVYVNEYSHLGHIISSDSHDKSDIINRRNILCGQINNVLCYFGRCCSVVKQRLLFTYCYSSYGSVLWDLENPYVESVCKAWRKGLRRAWGLLADTHCALLPIPSNCLPVIDELAKRSVRFIQNCLDSNSLVVRTMSSYGVCVGRMLSMLVS